MAKKRRPSSPVAGGNSNSAGSGNPAPFSAVTAIGPGPTSRSSASQAVSKPLPLEVERGDWTVAILTLMVFLAPAVGVPNEEMLQDTLKSIVVAFAAIGAGLLFFWNQRNRRDALRWHPLMWLPLSLTVYALGSMVWSHTYLGGVEAIRWFLFSLLLWLGINTLSRVRTHWLVEGIHWGAVVASLWTVLQFLVDFTYFPQGPNPASTFVNRNFFAEFVVCTLPFTAYLLAQSKGSARIALMAFTLGFNIVALLMTGTRGALTAMWLLALVVLPVAAVLYRKQFAFYSWDSGRRILAAGVLLATIVTLGLINTNNAKLITESKSYGTADAVYGLGTNAFDRAFKRTASISTEDGSLGIRLIMWKATARIIEAKPLTGVGAGAWEAMLPLYQVGGSQLETDYYVHNEVLQLMAEYGAVGWLFLIALFGYLLLSAWKTVRNKTPEGIAEAPMRAIALASLLAFLIVSNIGFPWRLAATGCMFALTLAILAASDARLQTRGVFAARRLRWTPGYSQVLAVAMVACLALTAYISQQAAATEQKIIHGIKLALSISQSGDYNNPKWDKSKREMMASLKEGIAINTHYRKITPMAADEMAKWGDWKDAITVWESVIVSRPYIVAIMSNIARGYAQLGNNEKALEYLARCEKLQPTAVSVRSLKVILLSRTGQEAEAARITKESLDAGIYDFDLTNAAYILGMRNGDYDMVIKSLELRGKDWPASKVDALLKLGMVYSEFRKDDAKALAYFKQALADTPDGGKDATRKMIPAAYMARL